MIFRTPSERRPPPIRALRSGIRGRTSRRALSLLEMMLVLAVLVAVGAMVLPALHGPLEDQRLLKSADLIRAQWTKARVTAMKNGRMYVFRYVTATDQYAIEPWSGEVDATEASQEALTGQTLPLPQATTEKRHMLGVAGQRLPDGVQFFMGETQADNRLAQTAADTAAPAAENAVSPIVFYPDGSTSDARLVLTNERFFVEITLRGLTGMVRVSELLSSEELSARGGIAQ